jgi:hypothetical protein
MNDILLLLGLLLPLLPLLAAFIMLPLYDRLPKARILFFIAAIPLSQVLSGWETSHMFQSLPPAAPEIDLRDLRTYLNLTLIGEGDMNSRERKMLKTLQLCANSLDDDYKFNVVARDALLEVAKGIWVLGAVQLFFIGFCFYKERKLAKNAQSGTPNAVAT